MPKARPSVEGAYNLRFPGQCYDRETGQHYNAYRDHDPQLGRYVHSDPIGLAGGIMPVIVSNMESQRATRLIWACGGARHRMVTGN